MFFASAFYKKMQKKIHKVASAFYIDLQSSLQPANRRHLIAAIPLFSCYVNYRFTLVSSVPLRSLQSNSVCSLASIGSSL